MVRPLSQNLLSAALLALALCVTATDGICASTYSGNNQTGVTTRTLPQPLIISTSASSVAFTIVASDGAAGTWLPINGFPTATITDNGTVATVTPDSQGYATSPQLTANSTAGSFTVTANDGSNILTFNVSTSACTTNPAVTLNTDTGTSGDLRSAINNACAASTIDLTGLSGTITLTNGRLRIDDNLTITGPGANSLAISGNNATRVFFIGNGNVSISNVTLENGLGEGGNGNPGSGGAAGLGGAIYQNGGNLTIVGVTFNGNKAQGGSSSGTGVSQGAGFGGTSPSGFGGDLFGIPGFNNGGNGGPGAGGGYSSANGGSGGFGGGGGGGESGNGGSGGFGGGGGGAFDGFGSVGSGGFGGDSGGLGSYLAPGYGGGAAGFGGAIFVYAGTLSLNNDTFTNNSAVGGTDYGSGGQGKGGAIFIYSGATATIAGLNLSNNTAAAEGQAGIGNSASPYTNTATCPGEDDNNICGVVDQVSLSGPSTAAYGSNFEVTPTSSTDATPTVTVSAGPCSNSGTSISANGANGTCVIQAAWNGVAITVSVKITPAATATSCVAPPANLNAWWKAEGNANDVTGEYNGTAGGDLSYAAGEVGQAFSFDGTQSPFVAIPAGAFPSEPSNGSFTFEAWFQTSLGGVILGQQNNGAAYATASGLQGWAPAIYVGTDGKLYTEVFYTGAISQTISSYAVNDGQWHHVAVTYDGSNEITYLDGASIGTQTSFTQAGNGSGAFQYQLGTGYAAGWPASNNAWYTFTGLIDEASVYSRALAKSEILGIISAASYGKCDSSGIYSGDNQTGATTRTLPQPFIVSTSNNPASVTFTVVPNGNAGGTFRGNATSAQVTPDPQGFATSPQLTANGNPGSFTVTANDGTNTEVFNVTTTACTNNPAVTATTDTGVAGELRYAVNNACAGSTIDLRALSGTITLGSRIRIDDSLTISGPGAANLAISGNNATRLFFIGNGNVSISNLTLQNGLAQGGNAGYGGGGAGMGGAIFQNGGSLAITGVTFSGNTADGGSAAFKNNTSGGGGFGGNGGSSNGASGGDLFGIGGLTNGASGTPGAGGSEGNPAGGNGGFGAGGGAGFGGFGPSFRGGNGGFGGGGAYGNGADGNAGFGGESSSHGSPGAGFGGAIFEYAGTLSLTDDTFTNNSAIGGSDTEGGGAQGKGGAIFIYSGATATAGNLSVSGNTAAQNANQTSTGNNSYGQGVCPGEDDVNICGVLTQYSLSTTTETTKYNGTFQVTTTMSTNATVNVIAGPCSISGTTVSVYGASGTCVLQATWSGTSQTATLSVPIGAASSCAAPPANLTAWWKAEGNTNDVTDAYNGTTGGDLSYASGEVGQAFSFDGTQSPYVSLPAGAFPASGAAFSFEAWFKTTTGGVILGHQDSAPYGSPSSHTPAIYVGTDGKLYVQALYSGSTGFAQSISSYAVNDGQWHHVAVTFDGTNQIAYVDGVAFGSPQTIGSNPQTDPYYQLGTGYTSGWPASNGGWYTFYGLIDEATVYSRALTQSEVIGIAAAGNNGKCDDLSLYSGNNQTGITTRSLPQPFIIVTNNHPSSVTFTVVPNGNIGGTFPGNTSSAQVKPDSEGFATSPQLIANGNPGSFTVTATYSSEPAVVFSVTTTACTSNPAVTLNTDTGVADELRYAVNNACAGSTIDLTGLSGVITLGSRIRIDDSLTIAGPGAANLAIDGGNAANPGNGTRIFFIGDGNVSIRNLTLENGLGQGGSANKGGGAAGMGGAIYENGGHLTVIGVTFSGNTAQGGSGGQNGGLGGGGFGGNAAGNNGAGGGDLFGVGGLDNSNGYGHVGGPGAGGGGSTGPNQVVTKGGNGGFGAGGGGGIEWGGGNGGFGAGGGGGIVPNYGGGSGGFGGGAASGGGDGITGSGGGGAGFGGAIFQYGGTLTLGNDTFTNNSAIGGTGNQSGEGKGGAIFIYSGATATGAALTFSGSTAAQNAGEASTGNNSYGQGVCPGEDDVNICGALPVGPPITISVSPNQGSGSSQAFTAVYLDGYGATDFSEVRLLINSTETANGSCYARYVPATGQLQLLEDPEGPWSAGLTPGGSGSVSNGQCTLLASGSSVSVSGYNLTVVFNITFTGFSGNKYIWLYAINSKSQNSGLNLQGSYTAVPSTLAPTTVSVNPSHGSGSSQGFTALYSEARGAADLSDVRMLINSTATADSACYVRYVPGTGQLQLLNNGGNAWSSGLTPGGSGSTANSQCTLFASGSSVSTSGDTMTVVFNITFTGFSGSKTIWLYAVNNENQNTGLNLRGSFTAVGSMPAPATVSVSPAHASGSSQQFTAAYSDVIGTSDLSEVRMLINSSKTAGNGCYVRYVVGMGMLELLNNAGGAWSSGLTPGGSGSAANTQCTLSASGSSVSTSGNTVTVVFNITFNASFDGNQSIWLYAVNNEAQNSGLNLDGTFTVSQ